MRGLSLIPTQSLEPSRANIQAGTPQDFPLLLPVRLQQQAGSESANEPMLEQCVEPDRRQMAQLCTEAGSYDRDRPLLRLLVPGLFRLPPGLRSQQDVSAPGFEL